MFVKCCSEQWPVYFTCLYATNEKCRYLIFDIATLGMHAHTLSDRPVVRLNIQYAERCADLALSVKIVFFQC